MTFYRNLNYNFKYIAYYVSLILHYRYFQGSLGPQERL